MPVVIGDFEVVAPSPQPPKNNAPAADGAAAKEIGPVELRKAREELERRLTRVWAH